MVDMSTPTHRNAVPAPSRWNVRAGNFGSRLHQMAPYIGKLKPIIANHLLTEFTSEGDTVLDCFSGSGTIPLEAALLGRRVLAFDVNPYAVTLTRAKLEAPDTIGAAVEMLSQRLDAAGQRTRYDAGSIPDWVKKFFHPETLQSALAFADECLENDDHFLLACLLSILHHQRPGFLSYPSIHLVPYLRDKKYPRNDYPDMYMERSLEPRLQAKLRRLYKDGSRVDKSCIIEVGLAGVEDLTVSCEVDAIVTSPPYMNALDYVRDNRLRMWFLDRSTQDYSPEPTEKQAQSDAITEAFATNALKHLRTGGKCILVVGETVRRKRLTSHPADRILERLQKEHPSLRLKHVIEDEIPDVRRSRRRTSATKRELILVLEKG
jgi:hypothetical protein